MSSQLLQLFATDFFLMALVSGLSLAAIAGPLGSFVVWRQMSFFGDTLAHSALLGIAIGLITDSNPQLSIIVCCLLLALLLSTLQRRPTLSTDTLLGILAHSALALGVVVLALIGSRRINLEGYLFGELLTITGPDMLWMLVVAVLVAAVLLRFWNELLSCTVHADLAEIEGLNVKRLNLMLVILLALTIAVSMKIVGVLLITSLLIIPPAAARSLASTPERMALLASLLGMVAIGVGLVLAFMADTPVGPTIVVVAATLFFLLHYLPPVWPGTQR